MTFTEAHDLMDILLDKADQAYFTTAEKDEFLSMAIMEWFEELVNKTSRNEKEEADLALYISSVSGTVGTTKNQIEIANNVSNSSPRTNSFDKGVKEPIYRILSLQVRKTVSDSYEDCLPYNSAQYSVSSSLDPFNKPTDDQRRWRTRNTILEVTPDTGLVASSSDFIMTYYTYPRLSNVAGGNASFTVEDPGTADRQLGCKVLQRIADTGTLYDETLAVGDKLGVSMESANTIIRKAVRMMTANIESPLYQVNTIEEKRSE